MTGFTAETEIPPKMRIFFLIVIKRFFGNRQKSLNELRNFLLVGKCGLYTPGLNLSMGENVEICDFTF